MKNKILLISGCSHAAGSEIDGSEDSHFNRSKSFGNLLAEMLEYKAVNISSLASNNQCIARTIIEWFDKVYDAETMDVKVLVAWTESTRLDVPVNRDTHYEQWNIAQDFISLVSKKYIKVNLGYKGSDAEEIEIIKSCHKFIVENPIFIELLSANLVLQMQYFFEKNNIDYLMCDTMHMFTESEHMKFYLEQINKKKYYGLTDNDRSFYWKYRNLGYSNPKAKFWHHGEEPHYLFAKELYNFYMS